MLAHQSGFFPRHVPGSGGADPLGSSVGDAHAHRGKACAQTSLHSLAPTDLTPLRVFEHGVCGPGLDVWDVPNPRSPAIRHWEDQSNIGRLDVLAKGDADGPAKAARAQCLPERSGQPITGIGQHAAEAHSCRDNSVDLHDRELRLCAILTQGRRHAGLIHSRGIARPAFQQELPQTQHDRNFGRGQRHRHQLSAVRVLAQRRGVLQRDANRRLALLRQRGVEDD